MVTPTGAAVVRALARPAPIPLAFEIERIGYGAGTRELEDRPNVLRIMLGRERAALDSDEMIEISANIDDLNPQIYDHVMDRLFDAGARDVTLTPTIMKKGRPAVTLSVIAEAAQPRRDRRNYFRRDLDHRSPVSFSRAPETASRDSRGRDAMGQSPGQDFGRAWPRADDDFAGIR